MQVHNLIACVRKATCLPPEPNCGIDLAITERAEMIISIVLKRRSFFSAWKTSLFQSKPEAQTTPHQRYRRTDDYIQPRPAQPSLIKWTIIEGEKEKRKKKGWGNYILEGVVRSVVETSIKNWWKKRGKWKKTSLAISVSIKQMGINR